MRQFSLFTRACGRSLLPGALAVCAAVACPAAMALTISGSPSSLAVAGKSYSYVPSATDTSGKTKVFKITNKH